MVEFFSTEISDMVCKLRNWSAIGCAAIISAVSASFAAAKASPSAAIILARFSRSASACFAIARCIPSGSSMSFISTTGTTTPHPSVCVSSTLVMAALIVSRSLKISSN